MIAQAQPQGRLHPFPGLRPFEPDEDHLFFGRERQIDELLRRLRTTRFLAVLGTSGCGKSSLVRSGLIPSLYGGAMTRAGSSWRIAILRPGEDPIGNLAAALDAPEALGGPDGGDDLSRSLLEAALRASNQGLVECVRQARIPPRDNVLVLVDQFEELFRFKQSRREQGRDEAVAFAKLLLEASRHREVPVYIALTMRSDFIGNCLELPELPEAINEGLYLVPRMTRDELRSAITGPVAVGGAAIAPRLVSRLLNDVGDDPDQLPILQHALMRTWDRWDEDHEPGEPLDLRHYEAIGTMKEALSRHAEEAFGELDEREQRLAEALFKALTEKEPNGRGIRRPVSLAEACALTGGSEAELVAVVECFRRPGRSFLMPPAGVPLRPDSVLDISHESLMRIWDRLGGWVDGEARSAQVYIGLARAAARHEAGIAALWRDPELQIAQKWREEHQPTAVWAARYDPSFERAIRFLDASAAEQGREIAEREVHRRRALRRAWILTCVFAITAIGMLALGVYAFSQKNEAEKALVKVEDQKNEINQQNQKLREETHRADEQRRQALLQKSRAEQERVNAERQTRLTEEQRQIADEQRKRAEVQELQAQANAAAANAARLEAEGRRSEAVQERQRADELRAQAESSEKEATRLSRLSFARALALQLLRPAQDEDRELNALLALQAYRLNRDHRGPLEDPDLFKALWTALLRLGEEDVVIGGQGGHEDAVRTVVADPVGSSLFTGSEDGKIRQWVDNSWVVLDSFGSGVRTLLTSEKVLAAAFADGSVRVWTDEPTRSTPRELAGPGAAGGALAFEPRYRLLAAGGADGRIRIWTLESPSSPPLQIEGIGSRRVSSLAFAQNGNQHFLAAGVTQGGARLWKVSFAHPAPVAPAEVYIRDPQTVCGDRDVRSVAFSPDGKTLACGTGRGEIVLWNLTDGTTTSLLGHASSVNSLRFDVQRRSLASASSDGTVRLWNLDHTDAPPIVLAGHTSWVWSITYMHLPEIGERLISGSADRTVRLWPAHTGVLVNDICARVSRGLSKEEWNRYMPADLPFSAERPCPAP